MSLLSTKTTQQKAVDLFDDLTVRSGNALHHAAVIMSESHREFWSMPDEDLIAALNYDPALTADRFERNTAIGTAINDNLDALGLDRFPTRAPVTLGRPDMEVDTNGVWSITA